MEEGSWSSYYQRWDEMQLPTASQAWDITLDIPEESAIVDAPTFSKWGPKLAALIPPGTGWC